MTDLRSAFWRYTAFQIPGWVLAGVGGWWLHRTIGVPIWAAAGVLVVWVVKDFALYPLLRSAYEVDGRTPVDRLVGERGHAVQRLAPRGYVRVRGELWISETDGGSVVEEGAPVMISAVDGNTLVAREEPANE